MTYIYLDDIRNPKTDKPWVVVRTYEEAVKHMTENGCPNYISLDHDLGMDIVDGKLECVDYDAKTGYDLVKWMVDQDLEKGDFFPDNFEYNLHTANPVGRDNMNNHFKSYFKFKNREL
jgi:hypothetical protein